MNTRALSERESFLEEVLTAAHSQRRRVLRRQVPEDREALLSPVRSIVTGLWSAGFSVEDAVRFILLTRELSPHLNERLACDEMVRLSVKYGEVQPPR